jgi:hypothetical protein
VEVKRRKEKQIGQSSLGGGGSLKSASLVVYFGGTLLTVFFMHRPMIPLAINIAVLDNHTRFTCFETNAPIRPTLGTLGVNLFAHLL